MQSEWSCNFIQYVRFAVKVFIFMSEYQFLYLLQKSFRRVISLVLFYQQKLSTRSILWIDKKQQETIIRNVKKKVNTETTKTVS